MCGIVGFIDAQLGHEQAERLAGSMCAVIRHRGPDDQGVWVGDGVALGMRRLAIIDVASGQQPIANEDGSVVVVFNGEIYNYRGLQADLRSRGHRFATESDTEVIVHAYEEYGDECVQHLRGMFVFALWDDKRRRLLAARDRFGKKPLNYYWDGRRLVFASEIKAILQAGIPRALDPVALDDYLAYGYVPAPETMFAGVQKLPAGHTLVLEDGRPRTRRYWQLSFAPAGTDDEATAVARTRALLEEAVAIRLMSEVPLGAFLSGGVDSSLVVALMSHRMAQPVKTFSIGFEEDDFSELAYARQVARHFSTDHHEFVVRPDVVAVLPQLVWAYDEPFADPSMLPTYYVSKLAREHVTVALTGDGGDEIFGGYERYARELAIARIPPPLRFAGGRVARLMPDGMRGKNRLSSMARDMASRCLRASGPLAADARGAMYDPDFLARLGDHDPYALGVGLHRGAAYLDVVARMQQVDTRLYLPDDILVKVDKASMLNSLETRAPLLDQELAAYVAALPSSVRTRGGALKHLLKRVAADVLPPSILARPKQGFGIPLQQWFRGNWRDYAHDVLHGSPSAQRGVFRREYVDELLSSHARSSLAGHGNALWALICLELWFQTYLDRPPEPVGRSTGLQAQGRHQTGSGSRG